MGKTHQRLRARLLAALGLPCAAFGVSCKHGEHDKPPPATPEQPTTFAVPPPTGRAPWTVSYSLGPNAPTWCATGTAQCQESRGSCASSIQSTCSCGPGQWCGDKQAWPCPAEYEPNVSSRERACCYALQRSCVHPAAGRALTEHGIPIFAPAVARADWIADLGFELPRDEARAALLLRVAAAEHASIASFARATLSLLALGAPPELLAETARAGLDEIEHARVAYALAALCSGESFGPGPLPPTSPAETDLTAFAVATLHDACVEETSGALQLWAAAEAEPHSGVRALLHAMAEDEARHVELAFRTLAWAVAQGGGDVRRAIEGELAALRDHPDPALSDVVLPCLDSLLRPANAEALACAAPASCS